jgi:hypothetical protein
MSRRMTMQMVKDDGEKNYVKENETDLDYDGAGQQYNENAG